MGVTSPPVVDALDTFIVGPPTDPKLRQIGEHLIAEVQAAALRALAHSQDPSGFPLTNDSLERLMARRLAQKPAANVRRAADRAASTPRPTLLESIDFGSSEPVSAQIARVRPKVRLSDTNLRNVIDKPSIAPDSDRFGLDTDPADTEIKVMKPFLPGGVLKPVTGGNRGGTIVLKPPEKKTTPKLKLTPYFGVRLRLHKLVCVEETTGGGADEIALAGIAIAANGATKKIPPFMVSETLDSGEAVAFGGRRFTGFPYEADNTVEHPQFGTLKLDWPRMYSVTFLLAEIDNGGFPGFVNDLFNLVKAKAAEAVGIALGGLIGGAVGSIAPGLGTAIGAAVGALVGWVLGALWEVFMDWWEDDEFVPITVSTKRKNQFSRFVHETSFDSTNKVVWWKGHGGFYKLKFDWAVVGGLSPIK
jgi:hypothetical protein